VILRFVFFRTWEDCVKFSSPIKRFENTNGIGAVYSIVRLFIYGSLVKLRVCSANRKDPQTLKPDTYEQLISTLSDSIPKTASDSVLVKVETTFLGFFFFFFFLLFVTFLLATAPRKQLSSFLLLT